jgi:hypothetical protein
MAATREAILGQFATPQGGPATVAGAFPQVGGPADNADLLQIVDPAGENVLINVDYLGVVHNPASGSTGINTRCGQFRSSISSGTTAALFAATFLNVDQSDILQIISPGGGSVYYLDHLGVAH